MASTKAIEYNIDNKRMSFHLEAHFFTTSFSFFLREG